MGIFDGDTVVPGYTRRFGATDGDLVRATEHAHDKAEGHDGAKAFHVIEVSPFVYVTKESPMAGVLWVVDAEALEAIHELGTTSLDFHFHTLETIGTDVAPPPPVARTLRWCVVKTTGMSTNVFGPFASTLECQAFVGADSGNQAWGDRTIITELMNPGESHGLPLGEALPPVYVTDDRND